MDASAIDPRLVERLDRLKTRAQGQPADVEGALRTASKQFQLWDSTREEYVPPADRERVAIPRAFRELGPKVALARPEATAELIALKLASAAAHRAFRGFRALLRSVLGQPFRR